MSKWKRTLWNENDEKLRENEICERTTENLDPTQALLPWWSELWFWHFAVSMSHKYWIEMPDHRCILHAWLKEHKTRSRWQLFDNILTDDNFVILPVTLNRDMLLFRSGRISYFFIDLMCSQATMIIFHLFIIIGLFNYSSRVIWLEVRLHCKF